MKNILHDWIMENPNTRRKKIIWICKRCFLRVGILRDKIPDESYDLNVWLNCTNRWIEGALGSGRIRKEFIRYKRKLNEIT
jgi:hypothetical protein